MASLLSKPKLIALNQAIVGLIQDAVNTEISQAASQFNKRDIVSFSDKQYTKIRVITKRNHKTFPVLTPESYSINLPSTYLRHEPKPPAKLIKFKKELLTTNKDRAEAFDDFIKHLRDQKPKQ